MKRQNALPSSEEKPFGKKSRTPGKNMEFVRSNKTELLDILSTFELIKDKVLEKGLIDLPEYNNLKTLPTKDREKVSELLDLMMNKGEEPCEKFLHLLRDDECMTNAHPRLKQLNWSKLDTSSRTESDPRDSPKNNTGVSVSGSKVGQQIDTLVGYIPFVSNKRKVQKEFFRARIQERDKTRMVIVFQTNTRDRFLKAKTEKSPVTLQDVVIKPCQNGSWPSQEIIYFNESSKLIVQEQDSVPFPFDLCCHMVKHIDLNELQDEVIDGNKVNVKVEIRQKLKLGHRLIRNGRYIPYTEYLVADREGSTSLTVWQHNTLTEKKWYSMTNLSKGEYNDQVTLQTTLDSELEEMTCSWTSRPSTDVLPPKTSTSEVVGFQLKPEKLLCRESHLLEEGNGVTMYCRKCDMEYFRGKLKRLFSGRLCLEEIKTPLELEDCHIRGLLGNNMVEDPRNTVQSLKEALSKINTVKVMIHNGNLLSVSPAE